MLRLVLVMFVLLQGAAHANCKAFPDAVKVPEGYQAYGSAHAKGDQIYQCNLKQGEYAWEYQAPDALLLDNQKHVLGKHFAGPTWEANNGDQITAKLLNKADVDPETSIPWLLLEVTGHKGKGFLTNARYISRIYTQGGLPPVAGCDGNHLGSEKRVPYTADYVFYKAR